MGAHLREFGSLCLEPHSERSISLGFSWDFGVGKRRMAKESGC